jgi:hypothetical protein
LNKAKQRAGVFGGVGGREDQSSENGRNRHRAR